MDIIRKLAEELQIRPGQAQAAVKLIDEGNTIPFISRYRKEATGALNDEVLRNLYERLNYLRNLEEKKEQVISSTATSVSAARICCFNASVSLPCSSMEEMTCSFFSSRFRR